MESTTDSAESAPAETTDATSAFVGEIDGQLAELALGVETVREGVQ